VAVDFAGLAAALLSRSPAIVQDWLPGGKFEGDEYHAAKKAAGGPGDSLTVNVRTGAWQHFATGDSGGDLVSLYAYRQQLSQVDAARELAGQIDFELDPKPRKTNGANGHAPALAVPSASRPPADAPTIPDHPKHGAATATWAYRDATGPLFHTARYDTPDGKQFAWFTWDADKARWRLKAPPKPRALYGLDRLAAADAEAIVLVVEGEKAADAATAALPQFVVMTWAGGAGAVDTADWSVLAGRRVYLWPDADAPGREAMAKLSQRLLALKSAVSAIDPTEAPDGWDVADAVADGWSAARISEWVKPRTRAIAPAPVAQAKIGKPRGEAVPIDATPAPTGSALALHQQYAIKCANNGKPEPCELNVVRVLAQHPKTSGKIWFDTFRQDVWHTLDGEPERWTDKHSRRILIRMQDELDFLKFSKRHVDEGILMYADLHARNSVHEFIESVPWDGINRIDEWLCDFLGCPNDQHHRAAGRNWLIGMVARAYNPGCQLRHMLILEGSMDKGKSTVLHELAQPWYATLSQRFGSKEFVEAIQGHWLIELADLQALAGARHQQILAEITNRDDHYRTPWDRLASDHKRRCVFAGTTEKHNDYLADTYGISRFWSIRCGDINIEAIKAIRQQLFAEALVQYRAGEPYWLMPEQTRDEQIARVEVDPYVPRVQDFLASKTETTALDIFEGVFVQRDDFGRMIGRTIMDSRDEKRIARILRLIGWYVVAAKRAGRKVNLWQPLEVAK